MVDLRSVVDVIGLIDPILLQYIDLLDQKVELLSQILAQSLAIHGGAWVAERHFVTLVCIVIEELWIDWVDQQVNDGSEMNLPV